MNFVEISSEGGPLLLNLDHVTSLQVENGALLIGMRGVADVRAVACPEAGQVYEFLREQLRPTSFVVKKPSKVGFGTAGE